MVNSGRVGAWRCGGGGGLDDFFCNTALGSSAFAFALASFANLSVKTSLLLSGLGLCSTFEDDDCEGDGLGSKLRCASNSLDGDRGRAKCVEPGGDLLVKGECEGGSSTEVGLSTRTF
jgi:hypothetical protein